MVAAGKDRDRARLELATKLGASSTINIEQEDMHEAMARITGGAFADVIVDATPDPKALASSLSVAARGARVVIAGIKRGSSADAQVSDAIVLKELTVRGAYGRDIRTIGPALAMLSHQQASVSSALGSHVFRVEDAEAALQTLGHGTSGAAHVTVMPRQH